MKISNTFCFCALALLFFSCSKAEESSQEIPAESFRNEVAATEVAATEVRVANAERNPAF